MAHCHTHFGQTRRTRGARSLILVEILIAVSLLTALVAGMEIYFWRAQRAKGALDQKCAQLQARSELSAELEEIFQAILAPPAPVENRLKKSRAERGGAKKALVFFYKPPLAEMWSLGPVARGRLCLSEQSELLLQSCPLGTEFSENCRARQLAKCCAELHFQFLHLASPFRELEQVAPGENFESAPLPEKVGKWAPTMVKVQVKFESGAIWESAHFLQNSISLVEI